MKEFRMEIENNGILLDIFVCQFVNFNFEIKIKCKSLSISKDQNLENNHRLKL
jgi:hypothetical protein